VKNGGAIPPLPHSSSWRGQLYPPSPVDALYRDDKGPIEDGPGGEHEHQEVLGRTALLRYDTDRIENEKKLGGYKDAQATGDLISHLLFFKN
jgi:hypothetical protein